MVLCLLALGASAGAASAASSPLVELVTRFMPPHADVDAAADAFALARSDAADGPAARDAALAYARSADDLAGRTAELPASTPNERTLRDALADADRGLAEDLRTYAGGAIGGAELDRRIARGRERSAARVASLVTAIAGDEGLDESLDGRNLLSGMAPVLLLVIGVVLLAAFTRRRTGVPRSRAS